MQMKIQWNCCLQENCFILEKTAALDLGSIRWYGDELPTWGFTKVLRRSVCRRHFSAGTCYTPYYHMFFESPATTFRLVNHIRLSHHLRSGNGKTVIHEYPFWEWWQCRKSFKNKEKQDDNSEFWWYTDSSVKARFCLIKYVQIMNMHEKQLLPEYSDKYLQK